MEQWRGGHRKRKPSEAGVSDTERDKAGRNRLGQTRTKKLYLTVATCAPRCKRDHENIAISLKPCKQLNPRVSATRAV